MSLLVILLALWVRHARLLDEPAAMLSGLMRSWRDSWLQRGSREGWGSAVVLAFIVLPPVLLTLAAVSPLKGLWHALLVAAVSLLVMLPVLLDRRQPDAAARAATAWSAHRWQPELVAGQPDLVVLAATVEQEFARTRRELLEEQLRELFAPLFWFLLLGPVAAVAYHFFRLCAQDAEDDVSRQARIILHYAEWPVVRVLALSFALAGDFVATWQHVRLHVLDTGTEALALLEESAASAQVVDLAVSGEAAPDAVLARALAAVIALLHRVLIIWVVLLALHTLLRQ